MRTVYGRYVTFRITNLTFAFFAQREVKGVPIRSLRSIMGDYCENMEMNVLHDNNNADRGPSVSLYNEPLIGSVSTYLRKFVVETPCIIIWYALYGLDTQITTRIKAVVTYLFSL